MSKGKYQKQAATKIPWIYVLVAIAVVALLLGLILKQCSSTQNPKRDDVTNSTTEVEKNNDSIAIPGYELLELKADSKEQTLCLPNPPQNTCYFQISLYMEEGTLLWESDLIEPGENSKPITLSKVLEKGTYPNAILRYSCYRMDEKLSPLNGAEMKLTLWVK